MECIQLFKILLFNMELLSLFILCVFSESEQITKKLDLDEGTMNESSSKMTNSITADEMCLRYFELASKKENPATTTMPVVSGKKVGENELPYMALLGFDNMTENEIWGCGGSLISDRWILTVAYCQKIGSRITAWARLGVSNSDTKTGDARPKDYRIVEHLIHPDYKRSSHYNDIALVRLETEVKFSEYIRPICLNSDPLFNPKILTAATWGGKITSSDIRGPSIANLSKVDLNVIPANICNASYISNNNPKLEFGINSDSMICAASIDGEKDSCLGDSGNPLQMINYKYNGMYTQFGITSFGKLCGNKEVPAVYIRVSKYIKWIESIVFSIKEN